MFLFFLTSYVFGATSYVSGERYDTNVFFQKINVWGINALIAAKADINIRGNDSDNPLHMAVQRGQTGPIYALIQAAGIKINIQDRYKRTPLYYAIIVGRP